MIDSTAGPHSPAASAGAAAPAVLEKQPACRFPISCLVGRFLSAQGGADWVKAGGALPNLPELVAELTTPTYSFIGGKFVLEDEDQRYL